MKNKQNSTTILTITVAEAGNLRYLCACSGYGEDAIASYGYFCRFMSFIYFLLVEIQHIFTRFKKKLTVALLILEFIISLQKLIFNIYKPFTATILTIACNNDIYVGHH